ncbi:MAG: HAD-IA family hydrolase [Gemmatimonadota bacterium]
MSTPHPVLFDLDGTLIDSIDLIVDSYLHVFRTHQLPVLSREELIEGIGTPLWTVFGGFTDDRAVIDGWIVTYREYNLAHHDQRVVAFPGVTEMLRSIHDAGRPLGLVTSKNHAGAERGLRLIGVRELFAVIVGADDVTHPKPHPEPVQRALGQLDAVATNAWYIGDSHHDIDCGNAAGVRTIGVTWGPVSRERLTASGPTHLIDTPDQLLDHLGVPRRG